MVSPPQTLAVVWGSQGAPAIQIYPTDFSEDTYDAVSIDSAGEILATAINLSTGALSTYLFSPE